MSPEERQNGVPITALREISILRSLRHANIVNVQAVAVGEKVMDEVYMVMDYAEQNYGPAVDVWSAAVVLTELLLSTPVLAGETPVEQLSLIVKLLGSPSSNDLAALSAMGCPELIKWRREALTMGRVDNIERRFLDQTSPETVTMLKSLFQWDPQARLTAAEALGNTRSKYAATAEKWWRESPRAIEKELLPTYPEVRNGAMQAEAGRRWRRGSRDGNGEYVFDFDGHVQRPTKRLRGR
ncbi:MAG: hypothetical protein Q9191_002372 [Dirinaria sp. TL-2023a]